MGLECGKNLWKKQGVCEVDAVESNRLVSRGHLASQPHVVLLPLPVCVDCQSVVVDWNTLNQAACSPGDFPRLTRSRSEHTSSWAAGIGLQARVSTSGIARGPVACRQNNVAYFATKEMTTCKVERNATRYITNYKVDHIGILLGPNVRCWQAFVNWFTARH